MTIQEILAEIPQLTIAEQLRVLDAIAQSLRTSITPAPSGHVSVVDQLYGAFKTDRPTLTDEDIDRIRYEALLDNHA